MHSCGNNYIFIENFDGKISCPESLCVSLCKPHYGIGGDGIVLLEKSSVADVKMRSFNKDGSEGMMAGNNIRCVAKYLYDNDYIRSEYINVETKSGVYTVKVYLRDGKVNSTGVNLGKAKITQADKTIIIANVKHTGTCVDVGNPHFVVISDEIETLDLAKIGPLFENSAEFPDRVNTEFVRVIDKHNLRVRVWERGNGETLACGTGACASVIAACEKGFCEKGKDITVKLLGGDMTVNYTDERVILTGNAISVFDGEFEY